MLMISREHFFLFVWRENSFLSYAFLHYHGILFKFPAFRLNSATWEFKSWTKWRESVRFEWSYLLYELNGKCIKETRTDNKCMIVYYTGMENENLIPFPLGDLFVAIKIFIILIYLLRRPLHIPLPRDDLAWNPKIYLDRGFVFRLRPRGGKRWGWVVNGIVYELWSLFRLKTLNFSIRSSETLTGKLAHKRNLFFILKNWPTLQTKCQYKAVYFWTKSHSETLDTWQHWYWFIAKIHLSLRRVRENLGPIEAGM